MPDPQETRQQECREEEIQQCGANDGCDGRPDDGPGDREHLQVHGRFNVRYVLPHERRSRAARSSYDRDHPRGDRLLHRNPQEHQHRHAGQAKHVQHGGTLCEDAPLRRPLLTKIGFEADSVPSMLFINIYDIQIGYCFAVGLTTFQPERTLAGT